MENFHYQIIGIMVALIVIRSCTALLGILLMLPGTFCHEASHWLMGVLTRASPVSFSIIPIRINSRRWRLGSVRFVHLTPENRPWVGMAPLALLPCAWHLAWRISGISGQREPSLWWAYGIAAIALSAWPSLEDFELAVADARGGMFIAWGCILGLAIRV